MSSPPSSRPRPAPGPSGALTPSMTSRRTSEPRSRSSSRAPSYLTPTRSPATSTRSRPAGCGNSADPEHRMVRCDPQQLGIRRVRSDPSEELPDLPAPLLQIGPQQGDLLRVWKLDGRKLLGASTDEQPPGPRRAQVAHPLRVPPRRHQVALPLERHQVHWRPLRLSALAPRHLQHPRPHHAHAHPSQSGHHPVEHVLGEPAGSLVVGHHADCGTGSRGRAPSVANATAASTIATPLSCTADGASSSSTTPSTTEV